MNTKTIMIKYSKKRMQSQSLSPQGTNYKEDNSHITIEKPDRALLNTTNNETFRGLLIR